MFKEELCDVCGRTTITKYCKIRIINVCVDCCLLCYKRSNCELRVWFKDLKMKYTVKQSILGQSKTIQKK